MALDLHTAKNEKEAQIITPSSSFKLQPHELIFNRFKLPEGEFPLFHRMEDYYADVMYTNEELPTLIDEVNKLKTVFSNNSQLNVQLNSIQTACENAYKNNLNIWVFCD